MIYSDPPEENRLKDDTVEMPWNVKVPVYRLFGARLLLQRAWREAWGADLIIVQQESRLVLNYLLSIGSALGLVRLSYFGHGRNFQSRRPNGIAERWKAFWALRCNWWFGYTEETRRHIESLGFPPERITVFNNSVDTAEIRQVAATISPSEIAEAKIAVGSTGDQVAIFVGGLYADKRLDFLVQAADLVRAEVADFELIVVGGGTDQPKLELLAASRPWLIVTGPRFGRDKAALMLGAKLFLMPGLVGLAILDAAALSLPMVTTAFPWHSPEIAYLQNGVNGVVVDAWEDPQAYASAVIELLRDDASRSSMAAAARGTAEIHTVESMAERFAGGILQALDEAVSRGSK